MQLHRNAKLGLSGRFALVRAIEAGCSFREAARRHGVSPATACEWSRRWRAASSAERQSLASLHDRSSRPHRCPRMLPPAEQERICEKRRRTGWGPRLLVGELGHPHSTVCGPATGSPEIAPNPCAVEAWRRGSATTSHTRSSTTTHGSPTPSSFLTSAPLPSRLHPAGARLLRSARHQGQKADGQRLLLHAQPGVPKPAQRARDQAPSDRALPATHRTASRTLPPNDGARVSLRRQLPQLTRPRGRSATLAAPLQHRQTAQLARRPASNQPRTEPVWAGHLGSAVMNEVNRPGCPRSDPPEQHCPPAEAPTRGARLRPPRLTTTFDAVDDVRRPIVKTSAVAQPGVFTSRHRSKTL
jgi:hypothetical protein